MPAVKSDKPKSIKPQSKLTFHFLTIDISASDFFCPYLMTVTQTLRSDKNVVGVTFLAFRNRGPDVVSTFFLSCCIFPLPFPFVCLNLIFPYPMHHLPL